MRLEFTECLFTDSTRRRQVVLERAMNSAMVVVTKHPDEGLSTEAGQQVQSDSAPGERQHTAYVRARLPVVRDALQLALLDLEFCVACDKYPGCRVALYLGGKQWACMQRGSDFFVAEYNGDDEDEMDAKVAAWEHEQREAVLDHPTVAGMLRVLCDNSVSIVIQPPLQGRARCRQTATRAAEGRWSRRHAALYGWALGVDQTPRRCQC